jgi:hypothetical protein
MPKDHEHGCAQVVHTVLGRADFVGVADVARDLDDEEVAYALVEENLHGHARVGTGDDRGKGCLAVGRGHQTAGKTRIGMFRLPQSEALVAFSKHFHGLFRADRVARFRRCRSGQRDKKEQKGKGKAFEKHGNPLCCREDMKKFGTVSDGPVACPENGEANLAHGPGYIKALWSENVGLYPLCERRIKKAHGFHRALASIFSCRQVLVLEDDLVQEDDSADEGDDEKD